MPRSCRPAICLLAALAVLGACGDPAEPDDGRLVVAVSVLPHAWLVEQIGGDRVRVVTLVEPGESPATLQLTDRKVSELMRAKVYFRTGVPFENGPWLDAVRSTGKVRIVDLREGIDLRTIEGHVHGPDCDHGHDEDDASDPHIWLEPGALKTQARTIATTLTALDPSGADRYEVRCRAFAISALEAQLELADVLVPCQGERLFLHHPAWGYFCDEFGLEQVAVEVGGQQPSDAEMTAFQKRAREDAIEVLYVQPQIAGMSTRKLADVLGVEVKILDPLVPDVIENLRAAAKMIAETCRE